MRRRWLLAAAAVALIVAACGRPSPPAPKAEEDPETLAAAALEHGDYAKAAALYRQAVERRPQSVSAHYGLGVATSNLSQQRDETIREFQWVVANGKPDSVEVEAARNWLITAGVIRKPAVFTAQTEGDRWNGTIEGQAYLGTPDQRQGQVRMQLHLVGQPDSATKEERRVVRTDNDGHYRFVNVAPGPYMLTDRIAGKPRWRLKIDVSPGTTLRLDLNPANSTDARDDFPNRPS